MVSRTPLARGVARSHRVQLTARRANNCVGRARLFVRRGGSSTSGSHAQTARARGGEAGGALLTYRARAQTRRGHRIHGGARLPTGQRIQGLFPTEWVNVGKVPRRLHARGTSPTARTSRSGSSVRSAFWKDTGPPTRAWARTAHPHRSSSDAEHGSVRWPTVEAARGRSYLLKGGSNGCDGSNGSHRCAD